MRSDLVEVYKGKRVLVTGHTGFKGSWLSLWLTELGAEVTGFALAPEYPRSHFELLGLDQHINSVEGDLRDPDAISKTINDTRPEFVFHLAAQAIVRRSYDDPKTTFDTNIGGGVNLLEAVKACPSVRSLVFVTSDKCYLNKEWVWGYRETDELGGHDPYSASKAAAEMVFMAYDSSYFRKSNDLGAATVRAGNVIGGGDWAVDRIVPDCIRALEAEREIVLRNPDATRPWQHVLDPLHGYLSLAAGLRETPEKFRGAWNFGPEVDTGKTVGELAMKATEAWGAGAIKIDRPEDAPFEHHLLQLSIDKAKLDLGWHPKWNSDRSIDESIRWYKDVLSGASAGDVSRRQIAAFVEGS